MESVIISFQHSLETFNIVIAFLVMTAYLVVDALYAYYTLSVASLRPVAAANSGAFMHFLLALGVLSYVQNFLYLIPIAVGSWLGTYVMVRYSAQMGERPK